MPNTVTQTTLINGSKKTVRHIAIDSDGSEETDLVIYDSSALATEAGITDPMNCSIQSIQSQISSDTGYVKLEFKATTDVLALALPARSMADLDFKKFGGIKNTGGTGRNGDILLTTTGLAAGDQITLIIEVDKKL
jgi:hypothetical protein